MKHNDEPTPDSGIGITFICILFFINFFLCSLSFNLVASPANKLNTGPLSRFISMVKNPHYSVLLNHKSSKFIPLRADGSVWQISIVDKDGNNSTFVWQLSKQTQGPFKDCWMVKITTFSLFFKKD